MSLSETFFRHHLFDTGWAMALTDMARNNRGARITKPRPSGPNGPPSCLYCLA
ncbi:protein of unknown function [Shewanella benthica]|uniref:Uncharacterized protein n=1 Tax=Shewanella benthica TaxID=43661 RepID=A0A330M9X5_9GAMM|nr:protein of unknown function [Shewanella benthica]